MVYYPKYKKNRKSNYRKKSGFFRKAGSALGIATKALGVAYSLKQLMNVEFKNYDTAIAYSLLTSTILQPLCIPTQGDSATTREGRSIRLKTINIRYEMSKPSTMTTLNRARVMVIRDQMPDGSLINLADVLINLTLQPITSLRNLDHTKRFAVLYDQVHTIDPSNQSPKQSIFKALNFKCNTHVKFAGTTGTISDITAGSYYFVVIPEFTTSGNQFSFSADTRARYLDN